MISDADIRMLAAEHGVSEGEVRVALACGLSPASLGAYVVETRDVSASERRRIAVRYVKEGWRR